MRIIPKLHLWSISTQCPDQQGDWAAAWSPLNLATMRLGLEEQPVHLCGDRERSTPSSEDNKCKGFEAGTKLPVRGTKRRMLSTGETGTDKRLRGVGSSWATRGLKAMVRSLNFILVVRGIAQKKI